MNTTWTYTQNAQKHFVGECFLHLPFCFFRWRYKSKNANCDMSQPCKWLQIQASQVWNSCENDLVDFSPVLTILAKLWKVGRAGNEGSTLRKLQIPSVFGFTARTSLNKVVSFDILSNGWYILNTWTELLLKGEFNKFCTTQIHRKWTTILSPNSDIYFPCGVRKEKSPISTRGCTCT